MSNVKEFIATEKELKSSTFSETLFNELMTKYLNDSEYTSHVMRTRGDTAIKKITKPGMGFKKMVYAILVEFGVDRNDAKRIYEEYEFKNKDVSGLYDFFTDVCYCYLKTGRNLKLINKEDCVATISFKVVEPEEKEYVAKNIKNPEKPSKRTKKKTEEYFKVKSKSTAPKWRTEKTDLDKNVTEVMKMVVEDL